MPSMQVHAALVPPLCAAFTLNQLACGWQGACSLLQPEATGAHERVLLCFPLIR